MSDFALAAGTRRAAEDAIRWNRECDQPQPPNKAFEILRINILASLGPLVEVALRSPTMSEQTITMLRFCHVLAHSVSRSCQMICSASPSSHI
jgi:hypothetical protein